MSRLGVGGDALPAASAQLTAFEDARLSTLAGYAEKFGGRLQLHVLFDEDGSRAAYMDPLA